MVNTIAEALIEKGELKGLEKGLLLGVLQAKPPFVRVLATEKVWQGARSRVKRIEATEQLDLLDGWVLTGRWRPRHLRRCPSPPNKPGVPLVGTAFVL